MFRKSICTSFLFRKSFLRTTPQNFKHNVAIIGASGGIGQPLSLLLKLNPNIGELRLHDLKDIPGVAADLSHIETAVSVSHADGRDYGSTLKGADIIVVPAGMPRKPGMKREDLFNTNAQVVYDVAKGMAEHSPDAILIIITNPINAVVPIACEVLKDAGKLNPRKIFGCSTLDSVRTNTFVAGIIGADPKTVNIPVIGGHSGITIIPLISRSTPPACIEGEQLSKLITRVQDAGTEVVKAKAGKGSATLSMAYAASRLTFSMLRALDGEANIVESAYVLSDVVPEVKYFATPLVLGKCGIEKNLGLGKLSDAEQKMVCEALEPLKKEIAKGEKFVQDQKCGGKKK
ncbi:malate dehydrogenase, mitochondrial-like [Sitophilus oryzae]|uniref:Malate dehydrogenase, mitochondrial n=1 Tax=Sitophilus oryzae TaxID=7048 RepID=A0A6J2YR38_SITOR|nr:malate dehydrogenase, mitochondrial-like [Sitophilus oryzae]